MTKPRGFYQEPPNDAQLLTAIVDFDGTLAENIWEPGQTKTFIGDPIEHGINQVNNLRTKGYQIVIFTARSWQDHGMIVAWLLAHEVPFDQVVCGKPLGTIYVDDKAINAAQPVWEIPSFNLTYSYIP